jgi:proline racemase
MRFSRLLSTIDVHAGGEIGRVVTSGLMGLPGADMAEKMRYINEVDDSLRRFLVTEPRASAAMTTNLLLPPTRSDADAAFLVLQIDRAHAMSGSNAMCVMTALLESGIAAMREPHTVLHLDTPAGLVVAHAECADGRCRSVSLDMPASFASDLDVRLATSSLGTVTGDVAFGGVFYFLVDARQVGMAIRPVNARSLVSAGIEILAAANKALDVRHPDNPAIRGISYVMFRDWDDDERRIMRNATILWPGRVDRSPCGTGSSARVAVLVTRGEKKSGDALIARSIIGSEFTVAIAGVEHAARGPITRPRVTGRAWIHGMTQIALDPSDPFPTGFVLSDTWGPGVADLAAV